MKVRSVLVTADMLVGSFNRNMMDSDRYDPRIMDKTATNINGRRSKSRMPIAAATAIEMNRLTRKYGASPMILPRKYIGRVMVEATLES